VLTGWDRIGAANHATQNRRLAALVFFGLVVAIMQVTLLREALEAAAGDELALAAGMTVWLLGTALGVGLGGLAPVRYARGLASAAGLLLMGAPFAALLLMRATPRLFHLAPGAALSLPQQLAGLLFSLLPVCLLGGAIFSLACRLPNSNPRSVYTAEAAGWLLGGLASTGLFVITQPFAIAGMMAYFSLAGVLLLWPTRWTPVAVATFGFCFGVVLPVSTDSLDARTLAWRWPAQQIVASDYTRHGHGVVLERNGQRALYMNGQPALVLSERPAAAAWAHLALLQVEKPRRVLLVGGLGGLLPVVLRHPVREVTLAEEEPELAKLASDYTDNATRTATRYLCVHTRYGDPRRLIRDGDERWDAILLNIPAPTTALANRCCTVEFFRAARRALRRGGVLVLALPDMNDGGSEALRRRDGAVYRALADAFPHVAVTPRGTPYLLASDTPFILDAAQLGRRLKAREIDARVVNMRNLIALKVPEPAARDRQKGSVNCDAAPVAYLHDVLQRRRQSPGGSAGVFASLASWLPWQAGGLLLGLLLAGVSAPVALRRHGGAACWRLRLVVALLGFTGMALSLLLLLIAQQALGALYHLLGVLMAAGMAGVVLGSRAGARPGARSLHVLLLLELLLAAGLPLLAQALPGWPALPAFSVVGLGMALAGAAVGAVFPLAVSAGISPGTVYTLDLLGAVLGGLSIVLLLPAHGLGATALVPAALSVVAIVSLIRLRLALPVNKNFS